MFQVNTQNKKDITNECEVFEIGAFPGHHHKGVFLHLCEVRVRRLVIQHAVYDVDRLQVLVVVPGDKVDGGDVDVSTEEHSQVNEWHGWSKDIKDVAGSVYGVHQVQGHLQFGTTSLQGEPGIVSNLLMSWVNAVDMDDHLLQPFPPPISEELQHFVSKVIVVETEAVKVVESFEL